MSEIIPLQPETYLICPIKTQGEYRTESLHLVVPETARQETPIAKVINFSEDNSLKLKKGDLVYYNQILGGYSNGSTIKSKYTGVNGTPIMIDNTCHYIVNGDSCFFSGDSFVI